MSWLKRYRYIYQNMLPFVYQFGFSGVGLLPTNSAAAFLAVIRLMLLQMGRGCLKPAFLQQVSGPVVEGVTAI